MAGLYFHIPFCDHKCIYCDFYSLPSLGDEREDHVRLGRFLGLLDCEMDLRQEELGGRAIDTIFFGGGTPSLLPAADVERVLHRIRTQAAVSGNAEVTLESNPGTVDGETLRAFRNAGVNRLSVGIQSFHDEELRFLTRIHSAEQAQITIESARSAGFENVNIDLMFGLPNQTPERWKATLEKAISLSPTHLSCYSLTIEPHTVLGTQVAAGLVKPVSPELDADLYEQTSKVLGGYGYEQYEVSNFARPGYRCRHNVTYWSHGEYLGFGPSAHSFLGKRRWWNVRSLPAYAEALGGGRLPVAGEESLSPEELMVEEIFLGLRSTGIDLDGFRHRHRETMPGAFHDRVRELVRKDLVLTDGHRIWLTAKGYMICDELCAALAA